MTTKDNTYYGIEFHTDFPLNKDNCKQLAGILFFSLETSAIDAQHLLNNKTMLEKINLLSMNFDCVIESMQVSKEESEYVIVTPEWLIYNILDWVQIFSLPTCSEISGLCNKYEVPDEELFSELFNTVLNSDVRPRIIIDYLKYFGDNLSHFQIDKLLDAYNKVKSALNHKSLKCLQNEKSFVQNGK